MYYTLSLIKFVPTFNDFWRLNHLILKNYKNLGSELLIYYLQLSIDNQPKKSDEEKLISDKEGYAI